MTLDRIREIISDNTKIDINEISADSLLEDDLAVDSMEMFKIITEIEEELDASLDHDKLFGLKTVGEINEFIKKRM